MYLVGRRRATGSSWVAQMRSYRRIASQLRASVAESYRAACLPDVGGCALRRLQTAAGESSSSGA